MIDLGALTLFPATSLREKGQFPFVMRVGEGRNFCLNQLDIILNLMTLSGGWGVENRE
jgi:hypothetical protein